MGYILDTSDKSGIVSTAARKKAFKDLNLALRLHPVRKDLVILTDDAAVKNAVKNLILTNFHERPFQSGVGANLRGLLFEPDDAITRRSIKQSIIDVLYHNEPRIDEVQVLVESGDDNSYTVTVGFNISEVNNFTEIEIALRRLR